MGWSSLVHYPTVQALWTSEPIFNFHVHTYDDPDGVYREWFKTCPVEDLDKVQYPAKILVPLYPTVDKDWPFKSEV